MTDREANTARRGQPHLGWMMGKLGGMEWEGEQSHPALLPDSNDCAIVAQLCGAARPAVYCPVLPCIGAATWQGVPLQPRHPCNPPAADGAVLLQWCRCQRR
jgi:hypothetical protein